jgi:hypothetical protein
MAAEHGPVNNINKNNETIKERTFLEDKLKGITNKNYNPFIAKIYENDFY